MARHKIEVTNECGIKEYLYGITRRTALNRRRKLTKTRLGLTNEEISDIDASGRLVAGNDVEKEVMAKDMLLATLDVTLRKALLPNKKEFLVVDTVGFVSKLPHDLVEAFKATLEEVQYADLILHVIDATNSNYELQKSTTEKVLKELGADTKPTILVYNKIDRLELDIYPKNHDDIVYISAKKGINMDKLIEIIQDNIMKNTYAVTLMLPYERGDIFSRLKNKYNIENFEYVESGITLDVNLEEEDYNIYKEYILEK